MSLALITTDAGRSAILDAQSQGLQVSITHVGVGSGAWVPDSTATALQNEEDRVAIAKAEKDDLNNLLKLNAALMDSGQYWISEVGFFADDGTLIFIWGSDSATLGYKTAANIFLVGISCTITDVPLESVTIIDEGQPLDLIQNMRTYPTVAALRAAGTPGSANAIAQTLAAVTDGDNGGAPWGWYPASTRDDDGATTVLPDGHVGDGRWEVLIPDGTVYVEWWGLPLVPGTDNEAGQWTDAGLFAWRNGYPLVTLKKQRNGMKLWGVLPFSNVTYDFLDSLFEPYVPAEPEGVAGYHAITIFPFGGHGLRVPDAWVARYNLRSNSQVNPMIEDPTVIVDHRYLHPDSPTPVSGVTWIEFKQDLVFDPNGYTAQTDGTSTLVPGQMVYLFRPRYIDAVDQSMACPNVVDYVDGETVHFRHRLMAPFARNPINDGTPVIFGGIATVPENFMIVNSHIRNFRVDISNVPVGPYIVNLWKVGPAFGCSCTDFEAVGKQDGASWSYALHPRGRNNLIGGLRKNGKRSRILGRGSMVANDQGNHNDWEHLDVVLTNWSFEYLGGNGYSALPGHFAEHSSIRMRHMDCIGPDYDADTNPYNGADLTQGSLNEMVDVTLHNATASLLQFTQVNGWGQLKARDVRVTGYLQGPVFSLGLADAAGTGAIRSQQLALDFDRIDVEVNTPPAALAGLTPIRYFDAVASTDASIRGCTVRVTNTESGEEGVWGQATAWGIEYDGEQSAAGVIGPDTWQYLAERLVFAHNVGLPEIRWRHYGVDILNTEGTKSVLNNYISLVSNAITYFRFSINEPDQQCVGLLYRLRLSDPAGVGGTAYFQGSLNCATTDDPDATATRTLKPTATELTLAAGTEVQKVALPVVRGGSVGYIPIGTVTLWRRANEGTAGNLYLHGVDVLMIGGR